MDESTVSLVGTSVGELVKPYKIHVSSKYLELTKKKLELTRLPHELVASDENGKVDRVGDFEIENGIRKSEIEPLIDYWLENYSWRTQEAHLNTFPQYRSAITLTNSSYPIRLHFIHIQSQDPDAIPLLLIPPFPFTNLSLGPLITAFTSSPESEVELQDENAEAIGVQSQNFHIIIPSIPGLGFSDSLSTPDTACRPLTSTAELFNTLMLRLGYESYIVSTTSSSYLATSKGDGSRIGDEAKDIISQIPMYTSLLLSKNYPENCRAIHLFDPPLRKPRFGKETWGWVKWVIAWFLGGGILGYERDDFQSFDMRKDEEGGEILGDVDENIVENEVALIGKTEKGEMVQSGGITKWTGQKTSFRLGQTQRTILSYALCDSPIGMLAYTLSTIRNQSSGDAYWYASPASSPTISQGDIGTVRGDEAPAPETIPQASYSFKELIDVTHLSWLPGPEAALRYADAAAVEIETLTSESIFEDPNPGENSSSISHPQLAITSFTNPTKEPIPAAWAHHTFFPFLRNIGILSSNKRSGMTGLIGFERVAEVVESIRTVGGIMKGRMVEVGIGKSRIEEEVCIS